MTTRKADEIAVFRAAAKEILQIARSSGGPLEAVARMAGVSRAEIKNWIARGQAGERPFAAFLRRYDEIEDKGRRENDDVIRAAAKAGKHGAVRWLQKHGKGSR